MNRILDQLLDAVWPHALAGDRDAIALAERLLKIEATVYGL